MSEEDIFSEGSYVTAEWVMRRGIPFSKIKQMELSGSIVKVDRGLYSVPGTERDELFIFQHRYPKGIFSGITALSIHGLTDHSSDCMYLTFPKGYNPSSIKNNDWHIDITRVIPELYDIGIMTVTDQLGNPVRVYEPERTLCDVLRGQGISRYILNEAMRNYFESAHCDISKLRYYADRLRVRSKIESYIDILSG